MVQGPCREDHRQLHDLCGGLPALAILWDALQIFVLDFFSPLHINFSQDFYNRFCCLVHSAGVLNPHYCLSFEMSQKQTPRDFLKLIIGRPVVVKLNSGADYRGVLISLDGYMNVVLEQTEEYVEGQLKNKYGDAFIRGNNVVCLVRSSSLRDLSSALGLEFLVLCFCNASKSLV
ncbi:U6 snRNA-associated Sm-like protein LSm6 [Taenia crassiceps]|uniref:U6 snRNA-associated Sm-like protein LSm6 n=1 Tax=Taenia crassiceps TaxID=6207 RepID=A0ABR4QJ45_9CEST